MTNTDKNYSLQSSSCCKVLQLLISDHIYSNVKFSLVFDYFLEHVYIYLHPFPPPWTAQLTFCLQGFQRQAYSKLFAIFVCSTLPVMYGLTGYCKEMSGRCIGRFLKNISLVTVIDMKWCVFQHLIGGLIHLQCSALCNSEIASTLAS